MKKKYTVIEPVARWYKEDDHEELQKLFVQSVIKNPNNQHTVRYLTEEHDNRDGTYETEHLVEITFLNACGPMEHVDHALESMNGRDWRMVCDRFLNTRLKEVGADPYNFDWPTPDVRVTLDYYEDEDDVVKTATVVWAVDKRTWEWCNPACGRKPGTVSGESCNNCDGDLGTFPDNVLTMICPHCGKITGVCCNCPDHTQCADGPCPYVPEHAKQGE